MNIKEFTKEVKERLEKKLGNFTIKEITKNNNTILNGIISTDKNTSAIVYIEDLFNTYNNGKNIDEIINIVIAIFNNNNVSYDYITNFNKVKDKLSLRLINAERNREIIKSYPYKKYLDFILIVDINVEFNGSIKVNDYLLKAWNKSFEEVFEIALNSTIPVVKSMIEFFGFPDSFDDFIYIITNKESFLGSAAMLHNNNEPLMKLAEKFNSDLYIFPSSIHEVIVIPVVDDDIDYFHSMVKNINSTIVSDRDYLSDNVYKYDKELNRISIVK